MFNRCILAVLTIFSCVFSVTTAAQAALDVSVTRGHVEAMPIAVTEFYSTETSTREIGSGLTKIITDNLKRSGLFRPVDPNAFIQDTASASEKPLFAEWRAINAEALVTGTVKKAADGRTRVEFRLWDVFANKQIEGVAYMTTPQNWRRIGHIISDVIYKRITGEQGYFDTRIVYIAESGIATQRVKRLAIMDQDGHNHRYLTDGKHLVLTPRFSPSAQEITYMAYYNNRPRVYLYNIDTGRQQLLGDFPGMTFSPRFSPDGNKVIMSMAKGGNSDIYTLDLRSKRKTRLTTNSGIDTSPCFSPDGTKVVFESDRGGTQQLYVMASNGGNAKRITFEKGRYANPVWSPRGDLIAFTKMKGGKFFVGVIKPDGSGERLIAEAYHVEGPTWSPNGRVLSYFKEKPSGNQRSAKVYTIDLTGYNERRLPTPGDGSDPAWSPLNQ